MYEVYLKQFGYRGTWVKVADSPAATRAVRAFIDEHDLGSSTWAGGDVRHATTHKRVATVSYNGRVWPVGGWSEGVEEITF